MGEDQVFWAHLNLKVQRTQVLNGEDEKQTRSSQKRPDISLMNAAKFYEKYNKNYKCATTEMCSFAIDQQ